MKRIIYLAIFMLLALNAGGAIHSEPDIPVPVRDGPYIFSVNGELRMKWIKNNVLRNKRLSEKNFGKYKKRFGLNFEYGDLNRAFLLKPVYDQRHKSADSIAIISDIHGEYDIYINLLKSSGIIGEDLRWSFGTGHLVIAGDVFDRGNKTTEVLWHLYGLELQAKKAGGKLHYLMGNHELMVLTNDLRYIGDKYSMVEKITRTRYDHLYSDSSVLGSWLRSKPVMMKIGRILFVHAGISDEVLERAMPVEQVNRKFYENFTPERDLDVCDHDELAMLDQDTGPVWYRGYFTDTTFCESRLDAVLDFYDADHIIVGHTPQRSIVHMFDNKILGVDTGIMYQRPGNILLYRDGSFYRICHEGKREKLN